MSQHSRRTAVLVDRHPLWLDAVGSLLAGLGLEVVGAATSGRVGLALLTEHRPDILVTSISLADDLDGIEVVRRAVASVPTLRPIVLSSRDDTVLIDAALAAGAVAYVVKTAHHDDIRSVVRQAFAHSVFVNGRGHAVPQSASDDPSSLTRREVEILRLVAEGHSNRQLAKMLWVTEQTVKFHLSNVYRKLDVANRTEASRWAQVHGLLGVSRTADELAGRSSG